jgi:hypothetical protein
VKMSVSIFFYNCRNSFSSFTEIAKAQRSHCLFVFVDDVMNFIHNFNSNFDFIIILYYL